MSFTDWKKTIDATAVSQTIGQNLQRSLIQKGVKTPVAPRRRDLLVYQRVYIATDKHLEFSLCHETGGLELLDA